MGFMGGGAGLQGVGHGADNGHVAYGERVEDSAAVLALHMGGTSWSTGVNQWPKGLWYPNNGIHF